MNGILILPINVQLDETGKKFVKIYLAILKDDKELIMVDCGYPNLMRAIEDAMNKIGLSLSQLTKIIITHHDHDHMGALREIKDYNPSVEILCSKEQAPFLTGKSKSLRLLQAESIQETLPESEKDAGIEFQRYIASIKNVDEVTEINSGDCFPWCGGVYIIDTKGHMPGHISLYIPSEKTLISGDALVVNNGKLCMAMPQYTFNIQDAKDSIRSLLNYDIEKIICYHGGVYDGNVKEGLKDIINEFN